MIQGIGLQDTTNFEKFEWRDLSGVNLIIGPNRSGKTNLLKMFYALTRSLQEFQQQKFKAEELGAALARKLRWTFQPADLKLGHLVRKKGERLKVWCEMSGQNIFQFEFGPYTTKEIETGLIGVEIPPESPISSLFFPPKEVLTTRDAIIEIDERLKVVGFDATYVDLARALRSPVGHVDISDAMQTILDGLNGIFQGARVEEEDGTLIYYEGREKYSIGQAPEGVKKVKALTRLIRSQHVTEGSVLFFDEPGANLHPQAILDFVHMLFQLSEAGVQIFLATHSYVVLKAFELLAREHDTSVPLCSLVLDAEGTPQATFADLRERIPENAIVNASMELFNKDLEMSAR